MIDVTSNPYSRITSKSNLIGDFDVQVDYHIPVINYPSGSAVDGGTWYVGLIAIKESIGTPTLEIWRGKLGIVGISQGIRGTVGGVQVGAKELSAGSSLEPLQKDGKLRLVRTGSPPLSASDQAYGYWWDGIQWVLLFGPETWITDDTKIRIDFSTISSPGEITPFEAYADNVVVNQVDGVSCASSSSSSMSSA